MAVEPRLTVRVRLTALAVLIVGVGLVAGSAIVLALVEDNLLTGAENAARQRARDTAALVAAGNLESAVADGLIQVVDRGGTVVAESPELRGRGRILSRWPDSGLLVETAGDGDYAVVAVPTLFRGEPVAVYAASSLDIVTEGVDATTSALLVAVPVLLAALSWACWLLVGRTLRPMNAMVDQLRQAHEVQRRFAGDAAHELRSPLAAILTQLEVGLAHPEETDWVRLARQVHREGSRLDQLTDELLALSRVDGERPVESVDLDELVLHEVDAVRARGKVAIELPALSAVRIRGRSGDLRRMLRNLLDNAERHARRTVTVGLTGDAGTAEIVVADDGEGIPEAERELIFERFYRVEPSRDRDTGGAGLGLAIAREIVTGHGGRIWVADSRTGAELHVRLPRLSAAP